MARYLDGAGDYLSTSGTHADVNGEEVTVLVWVKVPAGNGQFDRIIEIGGYDSMQGGFECCLNSGNTVFVNFYPLNSNTGEKLPITLTIPNDQWIPVVIRSKASGTFRRHTARVNTSDLGSVFSTVRGTAAAKVTVGAHNYNPTICQINATFGRVAIWSSFLSDADVIQLEGGVDPSTISASTLKRYWAMPGAASPEPDAQGIQDLTLTGDCAAAADPTYATFSRRIVQQFAAAYSAGSGSPRRMAQHFAFTVRGPNQRRIDQQFAIVYAPRVSNHPPSAPSNVAATTPADTSSTVTWDAATDPDNDPLQYEGDYWDGAAWQVLFALQTFAGALTYSWDTSGLASGAGYKVRIRAHDGVVYGEYAESNEVTVQHPPTAAVISAAGGLGTITTSQVSAPVGATSRALYGATSASDLPVNGPGAGAALLDGDWDGTDNVENIPAYGVTRYRAEYSTNAAGTTRSNVASATTSAAPQAVVALVPDSWSQFTATITPANTATDHAIYVALSPTNLFVAGNLYADSLGAAPAPVPVTDRTAEFTYYVGVKATLPWGVSYSVVVSITMPADTSPRLVAEDVTDTAALFRLLNVTEAEAGEAQYQAAERADTTYASPVWDTGTITEDGEEGSRLAYPWAEAVAATQYRTRARYRATSGDPWSEWLEVLWATIATPPARPVWWADSIYSYWALPGFLDLQTGDISFRLFIGVEDPPVTIVSFEWTDDTGVWTPIEPDTPPTHYAEYDEGAWYEGGPGAWREAWLFTISSLPYPDGFYRIRAILSNGEIIEHKGFCINNSDSYACGADDYAHIYNPDGAPLTGIGLLGGDEFLRIHPCEYTDPGQFASPGPYGIGHYRPGSEAFMWFAPVSGMPAWVANNRGIEVTANFHILNYGAGWLWSTMAPGEFTHLGLGVLARDGGAPPIYLDIGTQTLSTMELPGQYFPFKKAGVGPGGFSLNIGPYHFSAPVNLAESLVFFQSFKRPYMAGEGCDQYTINYPYAWRKAYWMLRPISVWLRVYRPLPETMPRTWRVIARVYDCWSDSDVITIRENSVVPGCLSEIDELVTLDYDLDCGGLAFGSYRPDDWTGQGCARLVGGWTARLLEEAGECENEPPPPEPPVIPPLDVEVEVLCGNVTVSALLGNSLPEDLAEADLQIRRADTLAVIYEGTLLDGTATWTFAHGVHTLPYDTQLQAAVRWRDDEATESAWSEWVTFTIATPIVEGSFGVFAPLQLSPGTNVVRWTPAQGVGPITYRVRYDLGDGQGWQTALDWTEGVYSATLDVPLTLATGGTGLVNPRKVIVAAADKLYQADSTWKDGTAPVVPLVRLVEVAAAGAGGEAEYRVVYLTVKSNLGATLRVTPILDGRRLPYYDVVVPASVRPVERTFEIPLSELGNGHRYGVRGTFFTVEIKVITEIDAPTVAVMVEADLFCGDLSGSLSFDQAVPGVLELLGVEVERDIVNETLPHARYSPELYAESTLLAVRRRPIVAAGAKLYQEAAGNDDPVSRVIAGSRNIMPEGEGGECAFHTLYLAISHSNTVDVPLEVVRYVDDVETGPAIAVTLRGVATPTYDVIEVPLIMTTGQVTYTPRGAAFGFVLRTTQALPATGRIVVDGVELEISREREMQKGFDQ